MLVYGVNPVNYDWKTKALKWLDIASTVAEEKELYLLFPGNVYVFNPVNGLEFDEYSPIDPISSKGKIRREMENRIKEANHNGAKIIVLRCGGFIGKHAVGSWFNQLIKPANNSVKLLLPGSHEINHNWAYLPDVAQQVVKIANKRDDLPIFSSFHFKGHQFSLQTLSHEITNLSGKGVRFKRFPWFVIDIMRPFSMLFAGLYEM